MQMRINALVVLAFVAGTFTPYRAMADAPAEMKALEGFVGTWKIKQATKTGDGRDIKAAGFTTTRWVLGGRYLEYVTRTNPGEQETLGMFTFDEARKEYRSWFFMSGGQRSEWTGTWDAKTKTLTRTATLQPGNKATATATFVNDDTIDFSIVGRRPDGQVIFEIKSTMTRQPDAEPVVLSESGSSGNFPR